MMERVAVRTVRCGVAVLCVAVQLVAQFAPGPMWRQEPPIGAHASEFVYVDAAGVLTSIGTSPNGKRVWRLTNEWQEIIAEPGPRAVGGAALAYDSQRGVAVMFGGWGYPSSDETWEFDGASWTQVQTATSPSARTGAAMTYDPVRQRCVLYGGHDQATLDDTWEYDGVNWTLVVTATTPQLRHSSMMAFDGNHQEPLLVGTSYVNPVVGCETWRYDGSDWHVVTTAAAPSARYAARMAFDPVRNLMVLSGGRDTWSYNHPTDTWTYNGVGWGTAGPSLANNLGKGFAFWPLVGGLVAVGGAQYNIGASGAVHLLTQAGWSQLTPEPPFYLEQQIVAYDSHRQCLVQHGGRLYNGQWTPITWEWRAATGWVQTSFGVGPHESMVYDPVRQCIVAVEGGQTFEYRNGAWTVNTFPSNPVGGLVWFDRHLQKVRVSSGNLLWTFDGQAWTSTPIMTTTPTGYEVRATHWSATGHVIASQVPNSVSWRFDGYSWLQEPSGSSRVTEAPLRGAVVSTTYSGTSVKSQSGSNTYAYRSHEDVEDLPLATDVVRGDVYAVGRNGEVWRLDWIEVPAIARYGLGCPGSNGIPDLRSVGITQPALGLALPLQLASVPAASGLAVLMVGDSIESWNGVPLPIALDGLGLPGCSAWIATSATMSIAHGGGATYFQVSLPATPLLAGDTVGMQALVLDPAANAAWASVSNALLITAY